MSEGTLIKPRYPSLYFDNVNISSVKSAEMKSEVLDREMTKLQNKLLSLTLATPKDITPTDEDPVEYITEKVNEIFDEMYDVAKDYHTVQFIISILDTWTYGCYHNDYNDIYENTTSNEELNRRAFPVELKAEKKMNPPKCMFAPDENTVDESIDRAVKNIRMDEKLSDELNEKYIIIYKGKPYVTFEGQFLFASEEYAIAALKDRFDFHPSDFLNREFLHHHPDYIRSIIDKMKIIYKKEFEENFNKMKDDNFFNHIKEFEFVHDVIDRTVTDEIMNILDIKIIKVQDLVTKA